MNDILKPGGWENPPPERVKTILENSKTIAVVGLSSKPERASNGVSAYMQSKGYRIIPVNPREENILGEKCYPDLLSIPEKVDVVDVFRRPEDTVPIAEDAVKIGAKTLWLQESVINIETANIAKEAGLEVVMDKCIALMHRMLIY